MYTQKAVLLKEISELYDKTINKNVWAKAYFDIEMPANQSLHASICADRCWRLYNASKNNMPGCLLLGEVSMRQKLKLVQNFGLTSAHGHEDDELWLSPWLGTTLKKGASKESMFPGIDVNTLEASQYSNLRKLQGKGSILSDRLWSPLMNDVWLLGGVHSQQDFHLVTEGLGNTNFISELQDIPKQTKIGAKQLYEKTHGHKIPFSNANATILDKWNVWFLNNPQYLYESWGARVLTRELIGLMIFGYRPKFTQHELLFYCSIQRKSQQATLTEYYHALEKIGFYNSRDLHLRNNVKNTIYKWLFTSF